MKYYILGLFLFFTLSQNTFSQSVGSGKFKAEFLEQINKLRQKGCNCGTTKMPPVAPLKWNDDLEKAAKGHAQEMAKKKYFSHSSKDGRSAMTRAEDAGYTHKGFRSFTVGENIAQGQPTIDEVMDGWFKSPSHCMNLMNPDFKEVGVWLHNTYWVQDFGGREEFSSQLKEMLKSGKARILPQPVKN
ncbi:CAP domain-containing protein [Mucilaginibacter antarcticus]|uniref:CAP domain-containing protein n=1 Tax=Mucilaginibacter antarcticus TaxID=1855725 RepID=A0ABW5XQE0_9SPHI